MTNAHWHIATGLAGYGPDGADDNFATAQSAVDIASAIRWELNQASEFNYEGAQSLAKTGDYKEAWEALKLSESLDTLKANLDYDKRATAPLYIDDKSSLDATIMRLVDETFPLDITHNTRLYVWQCDVVDCDQDEEKS